MVEGSFWSTPLRHSHCSNMFAVFSLHQQIEGGYELSTNLQGKWYKPTSTQHCDWGNIIHGIEYECSVDKQDHSIKITSCIFQ